MVFKSFFILFPFKKYGSTEINENDYIRKLHFLIKIGLTDLGIN